MKTKQITGSKNTLCVHAGILDREHPGINTPIYTSTAFGYLDTEERLYPRYFNIPNQKVVIDKVAALENAETGVSEFQGFSHDRYR